MVATLTSTSQSELAVRSDEISFNVNVKQHRATTHFYDIRWVEVIRQSDQLSLGFITLNDSGQIITNPSAGDCHQSVNSAIDFLRFRALVIDIQLDTLAHLVSS